MRNEWTVFGRVTALGQSGETIFTIGSVSSSQGQILTRFGSNFHQGQDAGMATSSASPRQMKS